MSMPVPTLPPLHVFRFEDDWFVAFDKEDAWNQALEFWGGDKCDYDDNGTCDFVQLDDESQISILCDAIGEVAEQQEGSRPLVLFAREWAVRNGRGLLCSLNY